jgi:5-methylthioadenosine/S-adenosylhomocysteine deaminase
MKHMGILERPVIAAHSLQIPVEDWPTLAESPFTAVMVPSSCTRSGVPAAPLKAMQAAGVKTALGTDNVANNNSYDLFSDMGLLGKLMSYREQQPGAICAQRIVEMATLDGAQALGLQSQIGSLEVGKRADWIALNLQEVGWAPRNAQDIYTALVYAVSGMHVRDVMVDGEWLLRDGKLLTLDYATACAGLEASFDELRHRRTKAEHGKR